MKTVELGRSGLRVSRLCLGTMTFGSGCEEATARKMMGKALKAGINFFDTADIYAQGETEAIVGRWLKGRRQEVVLASKVYYPTGKGANERGSSRLHILQGVEASLGRLKTDYLDLLYLHHWDDRTPIEESLAAIAHLVAQGKVVYAGVSNFSAWQTMKALDAARAFPELSVVAAQPMYSLVKRAAEIEILPMAEYTGIGICPYSPVGAGLLTGKYHEKKKGRITSNPMYQERYKDPEYMEVAKRFVEFARSHGLEPSALAIAWVLGHPQVTSPIIGARTLAQFDAALSAADLELTEDMREAITALSPAPPLATDREDPKHTYLPKRSRE